MAGRLECGTAWVNTHLALAPQQPFGGFKWSGVGVENGPWGLAEFTEVQVVYRSKSADGSTSTPAGWSLASGRPRVGLLGGDWVTPSSRPGPAPRAAPITVR